MSDRRSELRSCAIGYLAALALTGAAFAAVLWPPSGGRTTLGIVCGLGLCQIVVHFRFFLHVSLKRSARHDLQLILFSATIIALMVGGTFVLLLNLRGRMM